MHLGRTRTLLASLFFIALTTGTFSAQAQSPLSAYTQQQTEFLPVDEAYELSVIGTTERGRYCNGLSRLTTTYTDTPLL